MISYLPEEGMVTWMLYLLIFLLIVTCNNGLE
jgi:hypothetical protein